jgi:hypothetical protein
MDERSSTFDVNFLKVRLGISQAHFFASDLFNKKLCHRAAASA